MARVNRYGERARLKSAQVTVRLPPLPSRFILLCFPGSLFAVHFCPLSCIGDTLILIFAVTMDSYILLLAI